MNNKGFTMVELLVSMAIMGLLVIMAFPTIRAIQTNNTKTKYEEYGESAISAAKLYVDSYGVDIFDPTKSSQKYQINFDDLVKKDLIKDINISDSTCITGKSNIWVVKYNDDYSYCLHMFCKIKGTDDSAPPIYESIDKVGSCKDIANKVKTVKYVYNDGTNNNEYHDEIIDGDDNYRIASSSSTGFKFSENRDIFLKWVDESGKEYDQNTIYDKKATGSTVFTAKTRKWEYYLYFIKNSDGTYGGSMASSQKCSYGSSCKLTANGFTREGYTFKHWKNGSSSDTYTNEEDVKTKIGNKIPRDGARYDLTAIFRKNRIKITYHANGGSLASNHGDGISINSTSNKVFLNTSELTHTVEYGGSIGESGLINWNNASYFNTIRTGYSVKSGEEWNTKANGGGITFNHTKNYSASELCSNINNSDCDIIMYVKWVSQHTLSYNLAGGSGTCPSKTVFTGETWGTLCTPSKDGYHFDGWYNSSGTQVTSSTTATADVTVTARWTPYVCTVTYSSNGGVFNDHSTTLSEAIGYNSYFGDATNGMRNAKGGFYNATLDYNQIDSSKAWTDDSNTFDEKQRYLAQDICGSDLKTKNVSKTLKVNWIKNKIIVSFHSNGGHLAAGKLQSCPRTVGCVGTPECSVADDKPNCTGRLSGIVYIASPDYDSTCWASLGLKDHHGKNTGGLYMEFKGYTANLCWNYNSPNGLCIPELNNRLPQAKELAKQINRDDDLKKGNIIITLYAGWDKEP